MIGLIWVAVETRKGIRRLASAEAGAEDRGGEHDQADGLSSQVLVEPSNGGKSSNWIPRVSNDLAVAKKNGTQIVANGKTKTCVTLGRQF